jgi:hypothetical protein
MGRFPMTLHKEQWLKLLGMSVEIREPSGQRIACFCDGFPERQTRLLTDLRVLV